MQIQNNTKNLTQRILNFKPFKMLGENIINEILPFIKYEVHKSGEVIFKANAVADSFYLIESGEVSLNARVADKGERRLQSIGNNEILGLSCMHEPYMWFYDAIAITDVHTIKIDSKEIMQKLKDIPDKGLEFMCYFSNIVAKRLQATRLQLMDIYQAKEKH